MSVRQTISVESAALYHGFGSSASGRYSASAQQDVYFDDGTSITMSLKELVDGIKIYSTFFEAGRHEYFMVKVDGEDFAVIYPHKGDVDEEEAHIFHMVGKGTSLVARKFFEEAALRERMVLSYGDKPFGVIIPYFHLEP